jgi:hypothetical protein
MATRGECVRLSDKIFKFIEVQNNLCANNVVERKLVKKKEVWRIPRKIQ